MGTNYYLQTDFCSECGKPKTVIHLGKSSAGWKFLFHKQLLINNFEDVKYIIQKGCIVDEYGNSISVQEFLHEVELKQSEQKHNSLNIDGYDFIEVDFS